MMGDAAGEGNAALAEEAGPAREAIAAATARYARPCPEAASQGRRPVTQTLTCASVTLQVTGTRRWLRKLGLPVKLQWRPWKSATGQVGGYYEVYDGLTFATVRDAGHMVHLSWASRSLVSALHMASRAAPTVNSSIFESSLQWLELQCVKLPCCRLRTACFSAQGGLGGERCWAA